MKQVFAILLSLQLLSANSFFPELAKLPFLLKHFQEHQIAEPDIDFIAFLTLHYFNPNHESKDVTHHKTLPLKSSHFAQAEIFNISDNAIPSFITPIAQIVDNESIMSQTDSFVDSKIYFSIFQPPQV